MCALAALVRQCDERGGHFGGLNAAITARDKWRKKSRQRNPDTLPQAKFVPIAQQNRRPSGDKTFKTKALNVLLQFAFDAQVKIGSTCIRTQRGHQKILAHAILASDSAHFGGVGAINATLRLFRTRLAQRGAERAKNIVALDFGSIWAFKIKNFLPQFWMAEAQRAAHKRHNCRVGWVFQKLCDQMATHQSGRAHHEGCFVCLHGVFCRKFRKNSRIMTLSELWIYPIKSLGGISLDVATVEPRGLQYDRRWMLVDESGRFVTQREIPRMALLGTAIEPPFLSVFWRKDSTEKVQIPLAPNVEDLREQQVRIWNDDCSARTLPDEINDWFSDNLGQKLQLVMLPETTRRWADGRYAPEGQHVSFADGFPFLLIGQATFDDLNRRLEQPLPTNRFRPNFVFKNDDSQPFEEDTWRDFTIGEQPFRCVKPCARCIIITTDQETALRAAEPLKTLATFRKVDNKILFGQNVVWLGEGAAQVRVGDALRVENFI